MLYNELEQGDILSGVCFGLALLAYTDILLCSIWAIHKIRQSPVPYLWARIFPHCQRKARGEESGNWSQGKKQANGLIPLACLGFASVFISYETIPRLRSIFLGCLENFHISSD